MVLLSSLVERLGGTCDLGGRAAPDVTDVVLDSREARAGHLFAALPGVADDGARYAPQAVRNGAVAVLAPTAPAATEGLEASALWLHPEARRVAGEAAAAVHGRPGDALDVVAVTGTNGKTTVTYLVAHLLEHAGRVPAVLGTVGYRVAGGADAAPTTTPDAPTLHRLLARHRAAGGDAAVLEASSHGLVQERLAGLRVDVAVFTNLTRDHLDYHGSMEAYADAKARLFAGLDPKSTAVLNADDPAHPIMERAARSCGAEVFTYGTRSRADLVAVRWAAARQGTHLFLRGMGFPTAELVLPLLGRHNIENALAAAVAAIRLGASPLDAFEGLATASAPPGRLEPVFSHEELPYTVLVDYAHTPGALVSTLATLREVLESEGRGRLLCVFGCGGDRDRGKRPEMGAAVAAAADHAVVTSDNPRGEDPDAIVDEVLTGMAGSRGTVEREVDRRAAIALAGRRARPGDIVLIAGKGHEDYQITAHGRRPFDDRAVAREVLS